MKHLLPRRRPLAAALAASLLLCGAPHGHAAAEEDGNDKDAAPQEVAVTLPAAPQPENLLLFDGGPDASQTFSLDAKSLNIGPDGIIRYTLVAQSRSGARNISHEGLRCQSLEMKLYAFGHQDGSWSRPRREQWQAISFRSHNRPQAILVQDYFCQGSLVAGSAEEMLARIRFKRPLKQ